MSRERMTGRILIVWEDTVGTVLASDAAAGATVLNVEDVAPFNGATNDDGPGGWLQVGDQVVQYTGIDDDASTITLAKPLAAAVTASSETDDVLVWNDLYGEPDTVQWAEVKPAGKRHQADTIEAVVAESVDGLANGDRGGPGETCTLVRDGDEWELKAVRGRPSSSKGVNAVRFYEDAHKVTSHGGQTFTLTFEPVDHSEHVYWNGLYQPGSEWSRAGKTVTVPDAAGLLRVDDEFVVEYAYNAGKAAIDGQPNLVEPPIDPTLSPWGYPTSTIGGCTAIVNGSYYDHNHRVALDFAGVGTTMPSPNGWMVVLVADNGDGTYSKIQSAFTFTANGSSPGPSPTHYQSPDFGFTRGMQTYHNIVGMLVQAQNVPEANGVPGYNDPANGQFYIGKQILFDDQHGVPMSVPLDVRSPWFYS